MHEYHSPDGRFSFYAENREEYKKGIYHNEGSNPNLSKISCDFIRSQVDSGGTSSIFAAQFLNNNLLFHNEYSHSGNVLGKENAVVLSMPLSGYKHNAIECPVVSFFEGDNHYSHHNSKALVAAEIYNSAVSYTLKVCPHISVWKPECLIGISKSEMPSDFFSLHNKSIFGFRKDGSYFAVITSFNTDCLAAPESNCMIIIKRETEGLEAVKKWRHGLISISHPAEEDIDMSFFRDTQHKHDSKVIEMEPQTGMIRFTSPLINKSTTGWFSEFVDMVRNPNRRLVAYGEHIAEYWDYAHGTPVSLGNEISKTARRGVPTLICSRTCMQPYGETLDEIKDPKVIGQIKKYWGRIPIMFMDQPKNMVDLVNILTTAELECQSVKMAWLCDSDSHMKFIISDDTVILFTSNISFSSFKYGRKGSDFLSPDGKTTRISCLFAEISTRAVIQDKRFADWMVQKVVAGSMSATNKFQLFGNAEQVLTSML